MPLSNTKLKHIYTLYLCVTGQHPASDVPTLLISGIDVNGTSMIIWLDGDPTQWMYNYRNGAPIRFTTITGLDPTSTGFRYQIYNSVLFSSVFFPLLYLPLSCNSSSYTCCFASQNMMLHLVASLSIGYTRDFCFVLWSRYHSSHTHPKSMAAPTKLPSMPTIGRRHLESRSREKGKLNFTCI